jgi:hypothetical protein
LDAGTEGLCQDVTCALLPDCNAIHLAFPTLPSGVYLVQPPNFPQPFSVRCDMETEGGGWTLVGSELPGSPAPAAPNGCGWTGESDGNGALRFLDQDSGNGDELAAGTASGILGSRFSGLYQSLWINWDETHFIRFDVSGFDVFGGVVSTAVPVSSFDTSEADLSGWISQADGAVFCVATASGVSQRPGDTSWAVKPASDGNTDCGCNSGSWVGQGAYYGGTMVGEQTVCCGWGGGWAGAKDDTVQKGGISPSFETQLWIR